MPFDPTKPQAGTEIDAVEMRGQLNGLKSLIDAGIPGPKGPPGHDGEIKKGGLNLTALKFDLADHATRERWIRTQLH